jgi:hypothetical protein
VAETTEIYAATHDVLFDVPAEQCAVCDAELTPGDDEGGYAVGGKGLLMWTRGDERRYEEPSLCPTCASAIGVSALRQWEIEEEEG